MGGVKGVGKEASFFPLYFSPLNLKEEKYDSPSYCGKQLSFFVWNMAAIILQLDLNDRIARWTVLVTNSFSLTYSTLLSQDQAIFLCNELYLLSSGLELRGPKHLPSPCFLFGIMMSFAAITLICVFQSYKKKECKNE